MKQDAKTSRRRLGPIPPAVRQVLRRLRQAGSRGYIVGGAVRDLLQKKRAHDFDLASPLIPEQMMKLFPRVVASGIKYGTVTLLCGRLKLEHTTFRREEDYRDQRHPQRVFFSELLEEDLARRDFTVNALAYDPLEKILIDPFGGLNDLKSKTLRTVGNPLERFKEDALRVIRAGRFCGQLSFRPARGLRPAMARFAEATASLSPERVRDELIKILQAPRPSVALELLRQTGVLKRFLPELCAGAGRTQGGAHRFDIYRHSLLACDRCQGPPLLRLAVLFHDLGKVPTRRPNPRGGYRFYGHDLVGERLVRQRMRQLRFSQRDTDFVSTLVRYHMFNYNETWSDGAIRRLVVKVGRQRVAPLMILRQADVAGLNGRPRPCPELRQLARRIKRLLARDQALRLSDLALDGHAVMAALDIKPGPRVGQALTYLLEKVLENQALNKPETLLMLLREKFAAPGAPFRPPARR